jgi:hypothetical protein
MYLMQARLEDAGRWFETQCAIRERSVSPQAIETTNAVVVPVANGTGTDKVAYGTSRFELAPDQMLVVDLDVLEDRNWSVSLYNIWGDALDFQNRQTSLNGRLAHVDADGKVRLVVGSSDPGHPNWLDTAGNRRGIICYRLLDCSRALVEPKCVVVPAEQLAEVLPAEAPRLGADARRAALLRRRRHVAHRYQR